MNVLLYGLAEIAAILRSSPRFARLGHSATSVHSALELARRAAATQPDVIIMAATHLDTEPGLCRELRRVVRSPRSLLFVAGDGAATSPWAGDCDGVVPLTGKEAHLPTLLLPFRSTQTRRQRRVAVRIPVDIQIGKTLAARGHAVDLSVGGARLELDRLPRGSGPYRVRFHRDDGRSASLIARAAWTSAETQPPVLGLHFLGARFDTQTALADMAFWQSIDEPDGPVIHLYGELSEETPLWRLATRILTLPRLDLGGIRAINFAGAFRLLELLSSTPSATRLRLRRVPLELVRLRRFYSLVKQTCIVESHYALCECPRCHVEVRVVWSTCARQGAPRCALCRGEVDSEPCRDESVANVVPTD
jgi:ABC-type transporter Mla MlaB component